MNFPENVKRYVLPKFSAYTILDDGFEKLVGYQTTKGKWVHKDYRSKSNKKSKKKS